ncbi:MAG: hypothetical protein MUP66_00300 [Candidatus Nanohaloarchaeota archaeon QJJ-5]|nr:hypothetical protein [Candidatus Nanohaloarchaeota archaeon QJJ-5]
MHQVLLDANFLVLPFQFNVPVFDEIERLIGPDHACNTLERTYNEALNLEDQQYHQLVQKLVAVKDVHIIETAADVPVDQQLLEYAQDGYILCTNDTELKRRVDHHNLPHIFLRQQNHLEGKHLDMLTF